MYLGDSVKLLILTKVIAATDDHAVVRLMLAEGEELNVRIERSDLVSRAEWRDVVREDSEFVARTVDLCAWPSRRIIGTAEIYVGQIQLSPDLYADAAPTFQASIA